MSYYYNRQGEPIGINELGRLLEDENYKIVDRTDYEGILVSTVWLGVNHNFRDGPPLIFETMIFCDGIPELDEWQERYSTEQEALEGHKAAIALVNQVLNSKKG